MTATLRFDLDDQDGKVAHLRCVRAEEMAQALWDIKSLIQDTTKTRSDADDALCASIMNVFAEHNLNVDELIL
jgi:hypothetical protein